MTKKDATHSDSDQKLHAAAWALQEAGMILPHQEDTCTTVGKICILQTPGVGHIRSFQNVLECTSRFEPWSPEH
jgi:hypothetical protein